MVLGYQNVLFIMMKKYSAMVFLVAMVVSVIFIVRRNYMQFNSIVSVSNSRWANVHIQICKAGNGDPATDKLIFDQSLSKGQSRTFTINNGDDIVYRRDLDPNHPDGKHFTNWTYANYDGSSVCSIDDP